MKFDIIFSGLSRVRTALKSVRELNQETKSINNNMQGAGKGVKSIGNHVKNARIAMKNLETQNKSVAEASNKMGDRLKDATGTRPIFDMINGFKNMFATFGSGIKGVITGIKVMGLAFAKAALPVLAIAAIFKVLKLAWDANIGGIQTKAMKVFGKIRTSFAKAQVFIVKLMRKLAPVFELVFKPLIMNLKYAWALIKGFGTIIGAILKPILDVFKEIGAALEPIFKMGNSDGKVFQKVLDGIGVAAKVLGTTLGFIVKVGLLPLRLNIKAVSVLIKVLSGLFEKFKGSAAFEALVSVGERVKAVFEGIRQSFVSLKDSFMGVIDTILGVINGLIDKLPTPIKKLIGLDGVSADIESPAVDTQKPSNQSTVNNNQSINVSTSREIRSDSAGAFSKMLAQQMGSPY